MNAPARTNSPLRRPIAIASVVALTSGLALGFAPAAGADVTGGNAGDGGVDMSFGGGIQSSRPTPARPVRTPSRSSGVIDSARGGNGGNGGVGASGHGGNGGAGGTGPIECTDDNLDLIARATGGEVHALKKDDNCLVVHKFASNGNFTITSRPGFPLQILVVGAGGGAGGGGGWEDSTKASGAEPDSGGGAGGAGGNVVTADVGVNPATGEFTYTPTATAGIFDSAPGASDGAFTDPAGRTLSDSNSPVFTDPAGRTLSVTAPITVGSGGNGGAGGASTAGNTVGSQGTRGGDSAFGDFTAGGGGGGFGGRGTEGSEPGVQGGWSPSPRTGGQKGGSNTDFAGGDIGLSPEYTHGAPGGAGAAENGYMPIAYATAETIGNGGDGGAGVSTNFFPDVLSFGSGGGGGTIDPSSAPYAPVTGGKGGRGGLISDVEGFGGNGGAGGNGQDAPDGFGGGGGGGGTDGSVTVGDSNAGRGGNGGDGAVYVRYAALAAPATPAAPSVVAGNGSATLTITPLAVPPDYYLLWVAGDPSKTCTITPPETSCVIEGLTNGESYTFLAFAGNSAGESDNSPESDAITPDINAGMLPYTGNNTRGLTSVALTLIGLGGAVTALARRRRSTVA